MQTSAQTKTRDLVQLKNPVTNRYVKIDRIAGEILGHKKSPGPYKGVPISRHYAAHKRYAAERDRKLGR